MKACISTELVLRLGRIVGGSDDQKKKLVDYEALSVVVIEQPNWRPVQYPIQIVSCCENPALLGLNTMLSFTE